MRATSRSATIALGLGTLVSHGFGLSLVPAMLPRIEDEFGSGYGVLGLAVASGLLAYAAGALMATALMVRLPTRGLLIATYMVTGGGLAVTALATSPGYIALAVGLLGISAPISWTAAMHVAREAVRPDSLSLVAAGASGGAAVGVVINGILVQTSGSIHSWKVSFWIALGVAALAIAVTLMVFKRPVIGPSATGDKLISRIRTVIADPSGRMVIATSGISGVAVFTLTTFLTATAIDEMGVSDVSAAALLWIAGTVGVASALTFGRMADRRTPTAAVTIVVVAYASALLLLSLVWSYGVLVVAVIGYGMLNGPVWGLVASMANRRFSAELAVGAVSAGLVAASLLGALGNSLTGLWIESSGSMRGPVFGLATLMILLGGYLIVETRRSARPKQTISG